MRHNVNTHQGIIAAVQIIPDYLLQGPNKNKLFKFQHIKTDQTEPKLELKADTCSV